MKFKIEAGFLVPPRLQTKLRRLVRKKPLTDEPTATCSVRLAVGRPEKIGDWEA